MLLTINMFPSLLPSSSGWLYKSTKNKIICHIEYREPLNVKINVSHAFHLHTIAVYCILSTLVMLTWCWWQKRSIHVGN